MFSFKTRGGHRYDSQHPKLFWQIGSGRPVNFLPSIKPRVGLQILVYIATYHPVSSYYEYQANCQVSRFPRKHATHCTRSQGCKIATENLLPCPADTVVNAIKQDHTPSIKAASLYQEPRGLKTWLWLSQDRSWFIWKPRDPEICSNSSEIRVLFVLYLKVLVEWISQSLWSSRVI
jgi:hypothetical protein